LGEEGRVDLKPYIPKRFLTVPTNSNCSNQGEKEKNEKQINASVFSHHGCGNAFISP
jgi:hypothetical protein